MAQPTEWELGELREKRRKLMMEIFMEFAETVGATNGDVAFVCAEMAACSIVQASRESKEFDLLKETKAVCSLVIQKVEELK